MVDDLLCDAQDLYFESKYDDAIVLLKNALIIQNDEGVYEMLVLCCFECEMFTDALNYSIQWNKYAKRNTLKRSRLALLRSSYLCNDLINFSTISKEMISLNENIDEVFSLISDLLPNEFNDYVKLISKNINNNIVDEIITRINNIEIINEEEHRYNVGEDAYVIGVIVKTAMMMRNGIDHNLIEQWKTLKEGEAKNQIINAIKLLNGEKITTRGLHTIIKKYKKWNNI